MQWQFVMTNMRLVFITLNNVVLFNVDKKSNLDYTSHTSSTIKKEVEQ